MHFWPLEEAPQIKHFISGDFILSHDQLSTYDIPRWEYHHVNHYLQTSPHRLYFLRELSLFEQLCDGPEPSHHSLSQIYSILTEQLREKKPLFIGKWEVGGLDERPHDTGSMAKGLSSGP